MALLGKNLIISDSSGIIAAAKSCDIDVDADIIEVSSVTTGVWRNYIAGRKGWSVSVSHLVNNFTSSTISVGQTVTLTMQKAPATVSSTLTFNGFKYNVTVQTTGYNGTPAAIYWDSGRKCFVGAVVVSALVTQYYTTWTNIDEGYQHPSSDIAYSYSSNTYQFYDGTMSVWKKITGSAIVTRAKVTANVGNLVQGSFQFQGTGALAEANV